MSKPVSKSERARIVAALRAGGTCSGVAREHGRDKYTVSKIAAAEGIKFDRGRTKTATAAREADNRDRLSTLAGLLLDDAYALRLQLFAPHMAYSFGGRDNEYNEHEVPEPGPRDKQALMTSIGIAVDKVRQITQADDTSGLAAVDAWLRDVMAPPQ